MCFGAGAPKAPAPPPTERDAGLEGTRKRSAAAGQAGPGSTNNTGLGVPETGGTKPVLGG